MYIILSQELIDGISKAVRFAIMKLGFYSRYTNALKHNYQAEKSLKSNVFLSHESIIGGSFNPIGLKDK